MNKPYTLFFPHPPLETDSGLSASCQYPFQSATEMQHYLFQQSDFLIQKLHFDSFRVDAFELRTSTPFELNYELHEELFFLIFVRKGDLYLRSNEGFYQNRVTAGSCLFFRQPSGRYKVQLEPGFHAGLCVCFSPEWISDLLRQFPRFTVFGNHNYPACPPGPNVEKQLISIYLNLDRNTVLGRRQLSYYFAKALSVYHSSLQKRAAEPIYQARARVISGFTDPALKPEVLYKEAGVYKWNLRYAFLREFGISPARFLRHKRLQKAHYLKNKEKSSFNQLYLRCGFNDESTLRAAHAKFFKT